MPCTAIKVDLTKIKAADISVFMHWAHFKYQPLLKANQLKRAPFESFLFVLGERLTQGRSIAANISVVLQQVGKVHSLLTLRRLVCLHILSLVDVKKFYAIVYGCSRLHEMNNLIPIINDY